MTPDALEQRRIGLYAAFGAYLSWGLIVVYFKWLAAVDAPRILAHRCVWAAISLALLITVVRGWPQVAAAWRDPKIRMALAVSATLIGFNWLVFIWAVNTGHVLEGALGYFINPLMNVALGVWLLGERLRRVQILAIGLAALGVLNQTVLVGKPPVVALFLAASFAVYGLIRKKTPVDARTGLYIEMMILTVPSVLFLGWYQSQHGNIFAPSDSKTIVLLLLSGLVTTLPLMMFGVAARHLSLTTLGIVQYIAPTMQFALAVLVYHEPFRAAQGVTFALIWAGLALFTFDALKREHTRRTQAMLGL